MKIKVLKSVAGLHEGDAFSFAPGQIATVPDELAKELIKAGHAETVTVARKPAKRATKRG